MPGSMASRRRIGLAHAIEQRPRANVPTDILSGNRRKITPLEPAGIGWKGLKADQQKLIWKLVKTYVERARGEIAEADLKKITAAGQDNIHFAWVGGLERGQ